MAESKRKRSFEAEAVVAFDPEFFRDTRRDEEGHLADPRTRSSARPSSSSLTLGVFALFLWGCDLLF